MCRMASFETCEHREGDRVNNAVLAQSIARILTHNAIVCSSSIPFQTPLFWSTEHNSAGPQCYLDVCQAEAHSGTIILAYTLQESKTLQLKHSELTHLNIDNSSHGTGRSHSTIARAINAILAAKCHA